MTHNPNPNASEVTCPVCCGDGTIIVRAGGWSAPEGVIFSEEVECAACRGTGVIDIGAPPFVDDSYIPY
jgi:DnaJ-class molecular chaperone